MQTVLPVCRSSITKVTYDNGSLTLRNWHKLLSKKISEEFEALFAGEEVLE